LYPNEADMKWSKLLTNLLANASSAILDWTPYQIFSHPASCQVEILQIKEAVKVMGHYHYRVINLPSTPLKLLINIICYFPFKLSQFVLMRFVGKGRGDKMPSLHIDLSQGKKDSEVDFLNGAVVHFGQKAGIPTPVNDFLNKTLLGIVRGELERDFYRNDPLKLLNSII
ncbi:MAG: ketopantoate reductase family protein, partial [Anaerolineales bacterium]